MGLLAWRAFRHVVPATKSLPVISIVFCSLYGVSDEVHQFFVIGRSTDVLDWLADTIGAGIAGALMTQPVFRMVKKLAAP